MTFKNELAQQIKEQKDRLIKDSQAIAQREAMRQVTLKAKQQELLDLLTSIEFLPTGKVNFLECSPEQYGILADLIYQKIEVKISTQGCLLGFVDGRFEWSANASIWILKTNKDIFEFNTNKLIEAEKAIACAFAQQKAVIDTKTQTI